MMKYIIIIVFAILIHNLFCFFGNQKKMVEADLPVPVFYSPGFLIKNLVYLYIPSLKISNTFSAALFLSYVTK